MSRRRKNTAQRRAVANSAAPTIPKRQLSHINGSTYGGSTKHDHYPDFGWPDKLSFDQLFRMYCRNSIASAVVDKTVAKVWQDSPAIWESEEPTSSKAEVDIATRFEDIRLWSSLATVHTRAMVGRYAAGIIRVADGKNWNEPVERVAGLAALRGIIPAWESQLRPVEWDLNPASEFYGQPTMYQFSEAAITDTNNAAPRSFPVHPDRVLIWSKDGTVVGHSELESIFNDLIDAEKIKGAGGEGFWKTARGAMTVEAPEGMQPDQLARSMGVDVQGLRAKMNEQVDDFQSGFDKMLMLGGMQARTVSVSLPSPEHFFAGPINSIAAARQMPVKILMGSQSGERASTEDAREWSLTCNSIRVTYCRPLIRELINRFQKWGVIRKKNWVIGWQDLTEATADAKMERAMKMQDINAKTPLNDLPPFTPDEIRMEAGFESLDLPEDSDGGDDIDDADTGEIPDDQLEVS